MVIKNNFNDLALQKLVSYIAKVANVQNIFDDVNIATDAGYSSHKIEQLLVALKSENNAYAESLVNAITKLTSKKTTVEPTLENSELNVIYLYSTTGTAPFEQWLKINDTELVDLGSTNISLDGILTKTEAGTTYAKLIDFESVRDQCNANKTAIEEKVAKTDIVTTFNPDNAAPDPGKVASEKALSEAYSAVDTKVEDKLKDLSGIEGDIEIGNFGLAELVFVAQENLIPFQAETNSNIACTNGQIKLKANKTYHIVLNIRIYTSLASGALTWVKLYDITNAKYISTFVGQALDSKDSNGICTTAITYTPDTDVFIGARVSNNDGTTQISQNGTYLSIVEIPNPVAITNVVDEHILEKAKGIIAASINNSSTAEQAASAKDIWSMLGCKTFATLDELNSYGNTTVQCGIINSTLAKSVIPTATDYFFIIKLPWTSKYNTQIWVGASGKQAAYFRYTGAVGTWNTPRRICTTKVEDVPSTALTVPESDYIDSTWSSGGVRYSVKNGVCTVSYLLKLKGTTPTGTTFRDVGVVLPKPAAGTSVNNSAIERNLNGSQFMLSISQSTGAMAFISNATTTSYFYGTFNYPVYEG